MAFTSQNNDEVISDINVTPLVDVMLVLLVIFIVTAPLLTNAIPVNLPRATAVAPPEQKDPLVVSIDDLGTLFLGQEKLSISALEEKLTEIANKDSQARVQLRASEMVNYGVVVKVMAGIEHAGITKMSIITKK